MNIIILYSLFLATALSALCLSAISFGGVSPLRHISSLSFSTYCYYASRHAELDFKCFHLLIKVSQSSDWSENQSSSPFGASDSYGAMEILASSSPIKKKRKGERKRREGRGGEREIEGQTEGGKEKRKKRKSLAVNKTVYSVLLICLHSC